MKFIFIFVEIHNHLISYFIYYKEIAGAFKVSQRENVFAAESGNLSLISGVPDGGRQISCRKLSSSPHTSTMTPAHMHRCTHAHTYKYA